jgi:hypothetical protein
MKQEIKIDFYYATGQLVFSKWINKGSTDAIIGIPQSQWHIYLSDQYPDKYSPNWENGYCTLIN